MPELPPKAAEALSWVMELSPVQGLWSIGCILLAFGIGRLVARLGLYLAQKQAEKSVWGFDDILIKAVSSPIRFAVPLLLVRAALGLIRMPTWAADWLSHTLLLLLVFTAGWTLVRLVAGAEEVAASRYDVNAKDNLEARSAFTRIRVLRNIARFGIALLTVGAALTTFENVRSIGTGLLASTGVLGVVLGFAAQRSIATVIAGIHIAIAQPIRVDDVLIVEGEWGRVEEITLTYVVLRIWDLRRLVVPINHFLEKPFQNWTRVSADLLGSVELRVDYGVSLDALRAEFQKIVERSELWDKVVAKIQVTDAGERTMLVRALMSAADSGSLWDLRCEVREKLLAFLRKGQPDAFPKLRATVQSVTL